jgi:5'-nucleotidase/UDP-sugar diphosphatase
MEKDKIFFFFFLLFLTAGCAGVNGNAEPRLLVLHTNDWHGTILPNYTEGVKRGGIAEIGALIKAERGKEKNVLLLDAGDISVSRQFISNAFDGRLDIALYNMLNYDAAVFGNNEFQHGAEILEERLKLADFTFLGANVRRADGSYLGAPWIIKDYSAFKVGIFGVCTTASKEYFGSGYILTDEIAAAEQAVKELKNQGADIIIALTHLGIESEKYGGVTSSKLAAVEGIDLIVDGHSHTYIETPLYVNGVPIVSAAEYGEYLGKGIISVSGGKTKFEWELIPVKDIPPDEGVNNFVSMYAKKAEELLEKRVGSAKSDFEYGDKLPSRQETAIGNLITDAALWFITERANLSADFFFINSGTIRTGIKKGEIKYRDINAAVPFNDNLILLEMKGDALLALFEYMAAFPRGSRGFPQISKGAHYTVENIRGEGKLKDVLINSTPIDPESVYRVLTVDFILGGGNGYNVAERSLRIVNTGIKLRDAAAGYIEYMGTVQPLTDGRINILE